MNVTDKIKALITPTIESFDCELWGLVYQPQAGRSVLRIFVEKEGGVHIEDCEKISRQVSAVLDTENPIHSAYVLEVSSPGLDRLLFEPKQYTLYIGKAIKVKLVEPIEGQRSFKGTLAKIEGEAAVLDIDGKQKVLPFAKIQTAQLIF